MIVIFTQIIMINCRNIFCIQNKVNKSCILERLVGLLSFSFFPYILVTMRGKEVAAQCMFCVWVLITCADSVALDVKK